MAKIHRRCMAFAAAAVMAPTTAMGQPSDPPLVPPGAAPEERKQETAPEEKKEPKWYDAVDVGAFVDTYYSQNWRGPRPNENANRFQSYTPNAGFGLAWLGLDASVAPDPVGATLQLRFGPGVPNLALQDFAVPGGVGFVQNANVSWKPLGKEGALLLVMGKFDTVFGAEVAQSQLNINYTRGILYNFTPFFHTGLRGEIALGPLVTMKLLAVNGWNNTVDNNRGKTFGAQLVVAPADGIVLSAGYLGGPEENDVNAVSCAPGNVFDAATRACAPAPAGVVGNGFTGNVRNVGADSRWRHLVDVVGDVTIARKLRVVVNGDYVTQTVAVAGKDASKSWFGMALLGRYALSRVWAVGARGEVIRDGDGLNTAIRSGVTFYTGTVTVEAAPHRMLLVRLDHRVDAASEPVFRAGLNGTEKTQLTSTLGVVVKTN